MVARSASIDNAKAGREEPRERNWYDLDISTSVVTSIRYRRTCEQGYPPRPTNNANFQPDLNSKKCINYQAPDSNLRAPVVL